MSVQKKKSGNLLKAPCIKPGFAKIIISIFYATYNVKFHFLVTYNVHCSIVNVLIQRNKYNALQEISDTPNPNDEYENIVIAQ